MLQGRPSARLRYSWEARCRLVQLMLSGVAPQAAATACGAALAYGMADGLGGSGFIAAFVAGAVFRLALGRDPGELNRLTEEVGAVLNGITFVLFGAILLGPALTELSWRLALYAVLSLTLVRMVPVAVAMRGTRARGPTLGFLGWFGPRGLASIVFAVIVVEESQLPHQHLILLVVYPRGSTSRGFPTVRTSTDLGRDVPQTVLGSADLRTPRQRFP